MSAEEMVVLVDDNGAPIGSAPKLSVHTTDTPLHFAFSCHVTNADGEVLITRRALSKKTWPGVWTNSFCGHPAPEEEIEQAIHRRALQELGMEVTNIQPILPDFRYRAVDASGIVENEICPVFAAVAVTDPNPADSEVCEWQWVSPDKLRSAIDGAPFAFSPWLVWQHEQLIEQKLS
jgi:isopentenyl-diphosphate delta-isomerase